MATLTGKVAWVTGAGSGIGQAAAVALAKEGATVVLTGRRKAPLQETAATIKKAGGKADILAGDLMKAASVTKIAKAIEKKYKRCDILVNNAGLNILERQWAKLTPASAELVIDGNAGISIRDSRIFRALVILASTVLILIDCLSEISL